jgi:hypothetical protein
MRLAACCCIAAAIDGNLLPGGRVVAYQCRSQVAGYLAPHFGPPRSSWQWRSLTPMRVSVWVKPPGTAASGPVSSTAAMQTATPSVPGPPL